MDEEFVEEVREGAMLTGMERSQGKKPCEARVECFSAELTLTPKPGRRDSSAFAPQLLLHHFFPSLHLCIIDSHPFIHHTHYHTYLKQTLSTSTSSRPKLRPPQALPLLSPRLRPPSSLLPPPHHHFPPSWPPHNSISLPIPAPATSSSQPTSPAPTKEAGHAPL